MAADGTTPETQHHGGGLDAAAARYGGARADWLDLSTGINPVPYVVPDLGGAAWTALPDRGAVHALEAAARGAWRVPPGAAVLAAPGASALIARIPHLRPAGAATIPGPTYSEHGIAFAAAGWRVGEPGDAGAGAASARVIVHPNNPDGRIWTRAALDALPGAALTVIDESFADAGGGSLMALATRPGTVILKSFGKFWGLAGLRLGFTIGDPALVAGLARALGPWPVSGPALAIGAAALGDGGWAEATRTRLRADAARLDALMVGAGARLLGGTGLFRLYDVGDAGAWQARLAAHRIWTRGFAGAPERLRLGLPGATADWRRLAAALAGGADGAAGP